MFFLLFFKPWVFTPKYSQLSLFTVVTFYVLESHHEFWTREYWAIVSRRHAEFISCEPLVTIFSLKVQYITLIYVFLCKDTLFGIYLMIYMYIYIWFINIELTADSTQAEQSLSNTSFLHESHCSLLARRIAGQQYFSTAHGNHSEPWNHTHTPQNHTHNHGKTVALNRLNRMLVYTETSNKGAECSLVLPQLRTARGSSSFPLLRSVCETRNARKVLGVFILRLQILLVSRLTYQHGIRE